MLYNKSTIMKQAHQLRQQENFNMSYALQIAWLYAKKAEMKKPFEEELFLNDMKERNWNPNCEAQRQYDIAVAPLKNKIYGIWQQAKEASGRYSL